jgi:hypothetical protein
MSIRTAYASLTSNKALNAMRGIFTAMGKDVRSSEHAQEMVNTMKHLEERGNLGISEFRNAAMKSHPHKMDRINNHLDRFQEATRNRQEFLNSDRVKQWITS